MSTVSKDTVVTVSLISHTNVGKTTLARTLLRRDVGEIRDQAHVTEVSEAHDLIRTEDAVLRIWDTPGFGDTARLLARLRRERDPLGWFLHQVWDRVTDRPLFCSQRAVRNVRDEADVVLYLVNAAEDPDSAGYVDPEIEILTWMQRPVVVLLNQVGAAPERTESLWRAWAARWPIVREVVPLDAFERSWTEEAALLQLLATLVPADKQDAARQLAAAWQEHRVALYRECCAALGAYLERAASDRESVPVPPDRDGVFGAILDLAGWLKSNQVVRRAAMSALDRRLDRDTQRLMKQLIELNGLEGSSTAAIEKSVQDFQVEGRAPLSRSAGALAGAVVTGALGGLAADALAGGLTLGGGLIAGGILGALGGSALARGYRWLGGDGAPPTVSWTPDFLDQLTRQALLRYLAVAHFGRGQGRYRDLERPGHWADRVDGALAPALARLRASGRRSLAASRIEEILTAVLGSSPSSRDR